jgi:astacin
MGLAIKGAKYRWPNRTIPYLIVADLGCRRAAEEAIAHWNRKTCIRFIKRTNEPDYVKLYRLPGYAVSDVGKRGGEQKVGLGDTCPVGSIIHELGHAVGLWHEHCRLDRGEWLEIDLGNVIKKNKCNFTQNNIAGVAVETEDVGDYDYGSIMHYGDRTFAIDDRDPVLTPLKPLGAGVKLGQRDGLSAGDIAAVAAIYA